MEDEKRMGMNAPGVNPSEIEFARTLHQRMMNQAHALMNPGEAWAWCIEATMHLWLSTLKMGGDPLGMVSGWVGEMERMRERASSGDFGLLDPFRWFNDWYDATSQPWASTVEDLLSSEPLLAFTGPFLQNASRLLSSWREMSEASFKMLRLPTLSDIARLAELLIRLEEKVDELAETVEDERERAMPGGNHPEIEQRLSRIESRLEQMLALLQPETGRPAKSTRAVAGAGEEKRKKRRTPEAEGALTRGSSAVDQP